MQRVAAAFEPASLHVPDSLQGDLRRDHSGAQQIDHIDALPAAGGAAAAPLRGLLRRLNLDNDICSRSLDLTSLQPELTFAAVRLVEVSSYDATKARRTLVATVKRSISVRSE